MKSIPFKIGNKIRKFTSTFLFDTVLKTLAIQQDKKTEIKCKKWKGKKLSLFVENMIVYIENVRGTTIFGSSKLDVEKTQI